MIVILDSGVLGILCSPNPSPEAIACKNWLYGLLARGILVVTSDICDYEVRRGLILSSLKSTSVNGINNLDLLEESVEFLPISKAMLKKAAQLWAISKTQGIPTADNKHLDADIILCSVWELLTAEFPGRYIVIATTNVKHIRRFAIADEWRNIK